MTFEVNGDYNSATVHTVLSKSESEEEAVEQIQKMVDHEAFTGDSDVEIMSDFHWGSGAVIGFTMPVKNRICPNTIGVDIGCGMYAMNLGKTGHDWNEKQVLHTVDQKIRDKIPLGYDVHNRGDYHMYNDFPWELCQEKLDAFVENSEFDSIDVEYSGEYFSDLCKRVGYDSTRAIDSVGTLGGGNHFIEIGQDSSSDTWVIIHSGSRGIGAETAQHWQDKATSLTTRRQNIDAVPSEVRDYMTEGWKPKADKIREDFDGEAIQEKFNLVSQAIQKYGPSAANRDTDLDYLEGEEAHGYVTDMIFAQTYASESRKEMADAVAEVLNASPQDGIESVHNYIDFRDAVIRKGACRAHDGERLVIPFNIEYGTLICEGLGSEEWNNSAPHGAGRQMSRTGAKSQFSDEDFTAQTEGVYTSSRPIDEIPGAYKPPEEIESAIGETATVVDRVKPVLNIKDD